MSEFLSGAAYLPPALRDIVAQVPARIQASTQEIRLRAGGPVVLSTPAGDLLVTKTGQVTELSGGGLLVCDRQQLDDCFQRLCEYSVHTHQQEIREGYVSTRSGCRVGLAGSLVVEDGQILSMRQITSLCIRIARRHDGCASALAAELVQGTSLRSALLAGEPSSGKTSLLRDLARQLSSGHLGRRYRVAVVDERGSSPPRKGCPTATCCSTAPKARESNRRCGALRPTW